MRAVIQRVNNANVKMENNTVGEIKDGLLVLLGVADEDDKQDADYLIDKIINLRIFEDENRKMNRSLLDLNYDLLVISQFTLYGDCRKGRRPNFMRAARPEKAQELYEYFVSKCTQKGVKTKTGTFQEYMMINLTNDGPVTILMDSAKDF